MDDSLVDICQMQHVLEVVCHKVETASDGWKGVSLVADSVKVGLPIDLVLQDDHMPGMDGPGTVRLMRTSRYRGPIITISSNGSDRARDLAHKAGSTAFVAKPIVWKELLTVMQVLTQPVHV